MKKTYIETVHSKKRCQQRGISSKVVRLVVEHADCKRHVGDKTRCLFISKRRLASLRKCFTTSQVIERASGVMVIVKDDRIITVMHDLKNMGCPYRRHFRNGHQRRKAVCSLRKLGKT